MKGLAFFHVACDGEAVRKLSVYITELMRWNERVNLVGLKDASRVVGELLCDAFFLSGHVPPQGRMLDLGSGSGIIAIPLRSCARKGRYTRSTAVSGRSSSRGT